MAIGIGVSKLGIGVGSLSRGWTAPILSGLLVSSTSDTTQTITVTFVSNKEDGISWEKSSDDGLNWTVDGTSVSGTYNASGLTPVTRYTWRARAYKGSKFGNYSNINFDVTEPTELRDGDKAIDVDWLKGITKDGSNRVAKWEDAEGGAAYFEQTNGDTYKPVLAADGVEFDGNDNFMTATLSLNQPAFYYFVVNLREWIINNYLLDGITVNSNSLICYTAAPQILAYAGAITSTINTTENKFVIIRALFNGANSKIIIDEGTPVAANFGAANSGGITLGRQGSSNANYSKITVKRLVARHSAVGEANIFNYLKLKYDILFSDYCDGTSINTAKWTVDNANPTYVGFRQNNAVIIDTYDNGGAPGGYFTNGIKSKVGLIHGAFSFSSQIIFPPQAAPNYFLWGIMADVNNRIEFYTYQATNVGFRIVENGTTIYDIDNVMKDFEQVKIVVAANDDISLWFWRNDAWVQIGVTTNSVMGSKVLFFASRGDSFSQLSFRDAYICRNDRNSLYPETRIDIATDSRIFGVVPDGTTDNAAKINTALRSGNVILQNGNFAIGSSILVPSNRTLYWKNAKVTLLDDSFDNVFRNADVVGGNTNVNVIGLGCACIDGNGPGNDSVNYAVFGGVNMNATGLYKANTFFIGNVDTFEIKGISILDRPAYAGTLQRAINGKVHDIYLNHYTVTQNQDGIHQCVGCHDNEIYDIRGFTGDDFFNLYAGTIFPDLWYNYGANHQFGDIYNIDFHDIESYSCIHQIVYMAGDGNKIHDITFEDAIVDYCQYGYYWGGMTFPTYWTNHPSKDDVYNFTMDNIKVVVSQEAVFKFFDNCSEITITNFDNDSGKADYVLVSGDQTDNVTINGSQVV